ncbi:MAG: DUF202 domain-containing protein [Actinomycetes bacterium]
MTERRPRSVYSFGEDPDPRFSLANERTALAGIRTAVAIIAAGVALAALVQLTDVPAVMRWGAAVLCVAGAAVAVLTVVRWRKVERALRLQEPLPAPQVLTPLVAVIVVLALAAAAVAVVLGTP